jgi:succinyl-CoA synthetase alpha subunit
MKNQFDLMNILVGQQTDEDYCRKPVIVQGMTGSFGSVHTRLMRSYGTNIAAGVTPGKGGQEWNPYLQRDERSCRKDGSRNICYVCAGLTLFECRH